MRRILAICVGFILITMMVVACSPKEMTWEEKTRQLMAKHNVEIDEIWHYELKQNHLLVFYEWGGWLFVGFIDAQKDNWEWKGRTTPIDIEKGGYIFTNEYNVPFYITVLLTTNESVNEAKVKGNRAKLVQIHPENKIWIAYPDEPVVNERYFEIN
ncbi:hypothetical protein [Paenibacillus aceti]|uniref:Lipoprotein n=1 Tax=Paenibacillus aceti TaxID=1820010 RepID=A0ABQ1W6V6_9BACL|nr:hypothetical protein [Paenibacillus aceti]GGG16538.1 hypothetical protein GCM10010913_43210 [Paenibacillus aceti]